MPRLTHAPHLALVLALAVAAAPAGPALAQEAAPDAPESDGFSLIEEGARMVFRGLMGEVEPALDSMEQALGEMQPMLDQIGPQLTELVALIGDFQHYEAPVRLPNGDILIRRKPDAPPPAATAPDAAPPAAGATGAVDL